jgi:mono/diheme cytochrome c family protein
MKQLLIFTGFVALGAGLISCGGAGGNDPGHAYMPDMYYARAYETYGYNNVEGEFDSLKKRGIHYSALPVNGTVARGESLPHHLTGDSAGIMAAEQMKNPLDSTAAGNKMALKEAERLYLVNCGICHGSSLKGDGPLTYSGAYVPVPADFTSAKIKEFSDGHYFHVITFGIRTMGSYASQLTPEQRWWIIKYIRSKQGGAAKPAPGAGAAGAGATGDSAKAQPNPAQGGNTVVTGSNSSK